MINSTSTADLSILDKAFGRCGCLGCSPRSTAEQHEVVTSIIWSLGKLGVDLAAFDKKCGTQFQQGAIGTPHKGTVDQGCFTLEDAKKAVTEILRPE